MPLMLGAAAVIILTCASPTSYRDAPAIARVQTTGQQAVRDPSIRKLPVMVMPLEGMHGSVRSILNDDGLRAMRRRMAVNILLRSGYLNRAVALSDAEDVAEPTSYGVEVDESIKSCALAGQAPGEESDLWSLAVAVVSAEKFNRSGLHRSLEWHLADAMLIATGRLPDLSLGVAQIRPSTVRRYAPTSPALRALAPKTDDVSLRDLLSDECRSLGSSFALLQAMATELRHSKTCSYDSDCQELAVLRYGGRRHRSEAVVDYLGLVKYMKDLLDIGIIDPTEEDVPVTPAKSADAATQGAAASKR